MRRRLARELAIQSLYQLQMNEVQPQDAIAIAIHEAEEGHEENVAVQNEKIDPAYIVELVEGTLAHKATIDFVLAEYLKGWKMDRLSRIDREVLRMATFEMLYSADVPPKAVVNEAIELAKEFGTEESGKFVNGVLGKMIRELDEIKARI